MSSGLCPGVCRLAERELFAVREPAKRVRHPRRLVHAELRAMLGRQSPGAGDVVRVHVGVDHIPQLETTLAEQRLVLGSLDGRIDDRGLV